jgi:hypothetical protein
MKLLNMWAITTSGWILISSSNFLTFTKGKYKVFQPKAGECKIVMLSFFSNFVLKSHGFAGKKIWPYHNNIVPLGLPVSCKFMECPG